MESATPAKEGQMSEASEEVMSSRINEVHVKVKAGVDAEFGPWRARSACRKCRTWDMY